MASEEGKENVYEQKTKEEENLKKKIQEQRQREVRKSFILGISLTLPIILFLGFLAFKFNASSLQLSKKRDEEFHKLKLQQGSHRAPLKRLFY